MMSEVFIPDNLFAGNVMPVVTEAVTIASGAGVLTRGTVLGRITASGKCVAVNSGNADGSQDPYAVLAHDVDATAADAVASVYLTGEFNEDELSFGGTDTADTHRVACRKIGIFFKKAVSA